jgi:hypothetical protein
MVENKRLNKTGKGNIIYLAGWPNILAVAYPFLFSSVGLSNLFS